MSESLPSQNRNGISEMDKILFLSLNSLIFVHANYLDVNADSKIRIRKGELVMSARIKDIKPEVENELLLSKNEAGDPRLSISPKNTLIRKVNLEGKFLIVVLSLKVEVQKISTYRKKKLTN